MTKLKWMVTSKRADFDAIAEQFNIDKVLARVIRNRDVCTFEEIDSFLNGGMDRMHDPHLLKDLDLAVDILNEKIKEGKAIRIIGDYDVDGICSTYILLKGLRTLGANVDTVIPHRILDGYGLNDQLINNAHEDGIDTILTCDNGIAAVSQIELASSYGMTVVVTDHHEVPFTLEGEDKVYTLPKAACVVDPKREDCPYPFKSICGAMIAFKLIEVMLDGKHEDVIRELIPFAAMATVCDVMELLDENRIIVKEGIKCMKEPVNKGLKALKIATGLSENEISCYHFGFVLGPTINATGRLDTAKRALELFDTVDFNEACLIATELRQLNESRKKLTEDGTLNAIRIIEDQDSDDKVLVVYLGDAHESIAGIIAGRLKEKYYKPVIVLTDAEDGIKGSGRSIEGYNMYEELTRVNELFTKYGGHKMAAGVSLESLDKVDELRRRLNENCELTEDELSRKLKIDVPMPIGYLNHKLINSFELLEPCGTANPKPMFADKDVYLLSYEKKGRNRVIGKLRVSDSQGKAFDMVYFDSLEDLDEFIKDTYGDDALTTLNQGRGRIGDYPVKIAYSPSINSYNGRETIQIVLKYYDAV